MPDYDFRMKLILSFSTSLLLLISAYAAQPVLLTQDDILHPYEELRPDKRLNLFEMMEQEQQQEEVSDDLKEYEDARINGKAADPIPE